MIVKVALRSLAIRPWRTAVLAAGFGLGIGVMVALLGVGEVILEQAHAPALRGGGDLVVTSAFGPVENARYVLAQLLGAPSLRQQQRAVSPSRRAALYLVKPGLSVQIAARGGIPSLEKAVGDPEVAGMAAWADTPADASWSSPRAEEVLRAMDRFHPVPAGSDPVGTRPVPLGSDPGDGISRATPPPRGQTPDSFRSSWAEWLYFNGRTSDRRVRFYLTFIAGPPDTDGRRYLGVRLQLNRDGRSTDYAAGGLVDHGGLLASAPDLDVAGNRVRLDGSRYRITLALAKEGAGPPARLEGDIVLDAPAGRSLPPGAIHGARGWVSGYVVPVLSGDLHGSLRVGGDTISLDGATGYHDHNWGFWEGVRWQWGQVASGDRSADFSIVYGRVFPPASIADADRVPGALALLGPDGPMAFATNVSIDEEGDETTPRLITVRARGDAVNLTLTFTPTNIVRNRMAMTQLAGASPMDFLQLGGVYQVAGRAGGRDVSFTARGSAETFRP